MGRPVETEAGHDSMREEEMLRHVVSTLRNRPGDRSVDVDPPIERRMWMNQLGTSTKVSYGGVSCINVERHRTIVPFIPRQTSKPPFDPLDRMGFGFEEARWVFGCLRNESDSKL